MSCGVRFMLILGQKTEEKKKKNCYTYHLCYPVKVTHKFPQFYIDPYFILIPIIIGSLGLRSELGMRKRDVLIPCICFVGWLTCTCCSLEFWQVLNTVIWE